MRARKHGTIVGLVLALVLIAGLIVIAGCGDDGATNSTSNGSDSSVTTASGDDAKRILVTCAEYGSSATKVVTDMFKEKAEALGYVVEIRDAAGDYDKLVGMYETAVTEGWDIMVNSMADTNQLTTAYETAAAAGLPIIGMDCRPVEHQLLNVQSDNTLVGELMVEKLAEAIGGKGDIFLFEFEGHPAVAERCQAAKNLIASKYPDIKIVSTHAIQFPSPHQDCRDAMTNFLTANPKKGSIAGAIFGFDDAANGGVEAILAAGRNEIKVVSTDATPQTLAALMKNDPDSPWVGSVGQDWEAVSDKVLEACTAIFEGNPPEPGSNIKLPPLWVDATNAAEFAQQGQ